MFPAQRFKGSGVKIIFSSLIKSFSSMKVIENCPERRAGEEREKGELELERV